MSLEIDAASNNGVDEIRDIRDKSTYAPSLAKHKVYIIDEVHMLLNRALLMRLLFWKSRECCLYFSNDGAA